MLKFIFCLHFMTFQLKSVEKSLFFLFYEKSFFHQDSLTFGSENFPLIHLTYFTLHSLSATPIHVFFNSCESRIKNEKFGCFWTLNVNWQWKSFFRISGYFIKSFKLFWNSISDVLLMYLKLPFEISSRRTVIFSIINSSKINKCL